MRRFVDLGSGGGYPGLPARPGPAGGAGPARRFDRQEGRLPGGRRGGRRCRRPGGGGRGPGRGPGGRSRHRERWPAVTVRAVASLPELVELAFPLLAPGGILLAWKRVGLDDERDRALRAVAALGGGSVEVAPLPATVAGPGGPPCSSPSARQGPTGGTGRARRPSGSAAPGDRPHAPGGTAIRSAAMRVAVLSDIHANLPALDAVLAALGDVDAVWQLGDVVGYGPHPDEVVARLREIGATGVRGNHDAAALGALGVEWFNPAARRAVEWTARRISPETRAWLADLPERAELGEMTLVHGSPRDPTWEYVTTTPDARANLAVLVTPYCLYGHTHVPAAWREDDGQVEALGPSHGSALALDGRRVLLNPGSVGQPRDGDPRAAFLVLDTEMRRVTWHRVAYPIATTQADIRAAGLPDWLADRLAERQTDRDRRTAPAERPQGRRPARPDRAAAQRVLPLHGPRPADREAGRERTQDAGSGAPGHGPRPLPSDDPSRARRRSASGSPRRRRWPSSAPTPSAPPRTRPRRSSESSSSPAARRWSGRCRSRSRSPACSSSSRRPTARSATPTRRGAVRTPWPGRTSGFRSRSLAAAALLFDYVMTVAVSIAAGIAAITSVVPELLPYRAELAILATILLAVANLRGLRESGNIFAIPTYAYVVGALALIGIGIARIAAGDPAATFPIPDAVPPEGGFEALSVILVVRAFAFGSVALSGTEAITNGVPAFKPPEARNAANTMTAMGLLLGTIFVGVSVSPSRSASCRTRTRR